ncbi:hypothetical protein [Mycobacteroides abscessus]|uniref:hypothetical protein n=1 Tax=Mycobacteroides abscessus TaxID=36809 RepID=UPI000C257D08|nr:hypothetical protein [Mycobacteroides abscessus]
MTNWNTLRPLLAGIPALPGAPCKGRSDLYERTIGGRIEGRHAGSPELENARCEALRLCNDRCPALASCRAWLGALPATRRPRGVVAGLVITSSGTPAKRTTSEVNS